MKGGFIKKDKMEHSHPDKHPFPFLMGRGASNLRKCPRCKILFEGSVCPQCNEVV